MFSVWLKRWYITWNLNTMNKFRTHKIIMCLCVLYSNCILGMYISLCVCVYLIRAYIIISLFHWYEWQIFRCIWNHLDFSSNKLLMTPNINLNGSIRLYKSHCASRVPIFFLWSNVINADMHIMHGRNFKRIDSAAFDLLWAFWSAKVTNGWLVRLSLDCCLLRPAKLVEIGISQSDTLSESHILTTAIQKKTTRQAIEPLLYVYLFTLLRMLYNNKLHTPCIGANVSIDQEGSQPASQPASAEVYTCALAHKPAVFFLSLSLCCFVSYR